MKTCRDCSRSLPVDSFHKRKSAKDGLYPYCKDCVRTRNQEHYKKHGAKIRERVAVYRQENTEVIQERRRAYHQSEAFRERRRRYESQPEIRERLARKARDRYAAKADSREPKRRESDLLIEQGLKRCALCREVLPVANFGPDSTSRHGYNQNCRPCARSASRLWSARNPEVKRARRRAYNLMNPDKVRAAWERFEQRVSPEARAKWAKDGQARRRARKKSTQVMPVTLALIEQKVAFWGGKCWMCREAAFEEIDHVKPISKGGPHMLANLRPSCRSCNRKKQATWPFEQGVVYERRVEGGRIDRAG